MALFTAIAVAIAVSLGGSMVGYLGYRAHKRLEWNKKNDPWYTTTTTTTRATTTTTSPPTTQPQPKYRRRQEHGRIKPMWIVIPIMLTTMAVTGPTIENWHRIQENVSHLQNCGWGFLIPPILAATCLTAIVATNRYGQQQ